MQHKMLLAFPAARVHYWLMVLLRAHEDPWVFFCKASFQLIIPHPVLVHGAIPPEVQDFVCPFVGLYKIPVGLWLSFARSL